MKKILSVISCAFVLYACGQTETGPSGGSSSGETQPNITLTSAETPVVDAEGGSVEVTFSANVDWTARPINNRADDWLTLQPQNGPKGNGKVVLTAVANETGSERSATIKISASTASVLVTLTQKQNDALIVSATKTQLGKEAGTFTIVVRSNIEFTHEIEAGAEWLHYVDTKAITMNTLSFSVDANEDVGPREGRVAISSNLGKETVTIYQEAASPVIVLSKGSFELESGEGSFSVDVNHNVDVTVTIPEESSWITPVVAKSMSTDRYTFAVADNPSALVREADILFLCESAGLQEKVHVKQQGKDAQALGVPGIYGLAGLNWTYAKGTHQLYVRNNDYMKEFAFMDPARNKFILISVRGVIIPGETVWVSVIQNADSTKEAKMGEFDCRVDKTESGLVWLTYVQDTSQKLILDEMTSGSN